MNRPLASRVAAISPSAIRGMMVLGNKVPGVISLGQGIPDSRTPTYIRNGVIDLLKKNSAIGKYSLQPGLPELRALVAKQLTKKGAWKVDPDKNVCITAGAIEALVMAISSIVETGDEVLVLDPSYSPHLQQIAFAGGVAVSVPLKSEDGWKLDVEILKKKITKKTKALILCNPSNPTGTVMNKKELDAIVTLSKKHNFYIIADQTYEFLIHDGSSPPSLLTYPKIKDRLLICYSFSKEFSMTGWRVGYLYAPEHVMEQAIKVHDCVVICAPTISQYAAYIGFTKKKGEDPEGMHAELRAKRDLMCKRLDRLSDLFSYTRPNGAYYILARYKKTKLDSWSFAKRMLYEAKVISIPGDAFGLQGKRHVRFSYGSSVKTINQAFDRIERWNRTLT